MNFTQPEFFFLAAAALICAVVLSGKQQKLSILTASLIFYGWWDWRYLGLLLVSTTIDFLAGLLIASARKISDDRTAKIGLTVAIGANLAILGTFKYFDFFSKSLAMALASVGFHVEPVLISTILPIGISFYTFHAISYAVDVYRGDVPASDSYLDYLNFVTFFPQLVAGPIAPASHLLPQVTAGFVVRLPAIYSGAQLFLFGLVKKLVVADNMAPIVNRIFANPHPHFFDVVVGGAAFMVQIYCDFSGYTDMARGTARMFGIKLLDNFHFPYVVANPREFWRHWHISLSTWLRDYLFIPLGGSRGSEAFIARNLLITMVLGGLWHGANWNFALWGALHGLWLVIHRLYVHVKIGIVLSRIMDELPYQMFAWLIFSALLLVSWIIFRCSESADQMFRMLSALLDLTPLNSISLADMIRVLTAFGAVLIVQVCQRRFGDELWTSWPVAPRTVWYASAAFAIAWLQPTINNPFIYFQF